MQKVVGSSPIIRFKRKPETPTELTAILRLGRPARLTDRCRRFGGLTVLIALVCVSSGCGTSSESSSSASTSAASRTWSIVALGDSVPSGYKCHCRPYPQLSADGLTATTGQTVTATNDAVAGYTTSNVLRQLQSDSAVIDKVSKADAVEINVGANDIPYNTNSCGASVDCYAPLVPSVQKHLAAIGSRVRELTSGRKVLVVLLDYWSIWLGGTYAREQGHAYVNAAREITAEVDAAIKTAATESGSAYVSERRAFKGPSFGYIESHYLAADGEHPNAAGHQAIATTTETVIEKTLHI
jgi:lysophospholipase L1-like esterase